MWTPLEDEEIFPLKVGQNYGRRPYPTLVSARPELVPLFRERMTAIARP